MFSVGTVEYRVIAEARLQSCLGCSTSVNHKLLGKNDPFIDEIIKYGSSGSITESTVAY